MTGYFLLWISGAGHWSVDALWPITHFRRFVCGLMSVTFRLTQVRNAELALMQRFNGRAKMRTFKVRLPSWKALGVVSYFLPARRVPSIATISNSSIMRIDKAFGSCCTENGQHEVLN
jgi:hypothetical protein